MPTQPLVQYQPFLYSETNSFQKSKVNCYLYLHTSLITFPGLQNKPQTMSFLRLPPQWHHHSKAKPPNSATHTQRGHHKRPKWRHPLLSAAEPQQLNSSPENRLTVVIEVRRFWFTYIYTHAHTTGILRTQHLG